MEIMEIIVCLALEEVEMDVLAVVVLEEILMEMD
jgi:hypothetical protein